MKRWPIELDGVAAGHIYADTLDAARRAAQAAYRRIYPERDAERGIVRVGDGSEVESPAAEARTLVSQVYEGLRLLPGMELPAEKLRGAVVLLESVAARHGLRPQVSSGSDVQSGGGGDTELGEAMAPVLASRVVPDVARERLRGLVEWVGVNTPEAERRKVELESFRGLWEAGLLDPRLANTPQCKLYRASAHLVSRLDEAGALRLERFPGAKTVEEFRAALRSCGKDGFTMLWAFVPPSEADEVSVLRPLAFVNDRMLQPALLVRGVGCAEEEAVALDRALFDALSRLRTWTDGLGRLAEPLLDEKDRQLIARGEKRIEDVRQRMAAAAKEGQPVLPSEATRRDLIKFVIDQAHRIADSLAFLPDRGLWDAFGELVFKDVVFRGCGAYLSKHHAIDIDTDLVEGADSQGLAGRFKTATSGPRPKHRTTRIHSVVLPCYTQDGAVIRPATVRLGEY